MREILLKEEFIFLNRLWLFEPYSMKNGLFEGKSVIVLTEKTWQFFKSNQITLCTQVVMIPLREKENLPSESKNI